MTLLIVSLSACAHLSCKKGPDIEWCVWNGDGSAECILTGGEEMSKSEVELTNYVGTNAQDAEKLLHWCRRNQREVNTTSNSN